MQGRNTFHRVYCAFFMPVSNVRGPPTLAVNADITSCLPSANSGREQSQQTQRLFNHLVGAERLGGL
jgi:hypothetical protein